MDDLVKSLQKVYSYVRESIIAEQEKRSAADRAKIISTRFSHGDLVLLLRDETGPNVSKHTSRPYIGPYMVKRVTDRDSYFLCDIDTLTEDLGFSQPVHIRRLKLFYLSPDLSRAATAKSRKRIAVYILDGDGHGAWYAGTVTGVGKFDNVYVRWDNGDEPEKIDLDLQRHEWYDDDDVIPSVYYGVEPPVSQKRTPSQTSVSVPPHTTTTTRTTVTIQPHSITADKQVSSNSSHRTSSTSSEVMTHKTPIPTTDSRPRRRSERQALKK